MKTRNVEYIKELKNAKLVIWKPYIDCCPNDCGGKEFDKIEYRAYCPTCGKEFRNNSDITKYCSECGTKLWRDYKCPTIVERSECDGTQKMEHDLPKVR